MSLPTFPIGQQLPTRDEALNQIISSIAMEELGLSHIINAEGEKLQYALGTIPGVTGPATPPSIQELLDLNGSIHKTLDSALLNQLFLKEKLKYALDTPAMAGPTGPTGATGPTGPTGAMGDGITILGQVDDPSQLPPDGNTPGDVYSVDGVLYLWTIDQTGQGHWDEIHNLHGPTGPTGPTGQNGADGIMGPILGVVPTQAELPAAGAGQGDLYYVEADDALFVWDDLNGWVSIGLAQGPRGPIGPTGPAGPTGPVGNLSPGQRLFYAAAQTASLPVAFEGTLAFRSSTLDVTVEPGPAVRIEDTGIRGQILPFGTGHSQTLTTSALGTRARVILVGHGDGQAIVSAPSDPLNTFLLPDFSVPMPVDGTLKKITGFFSLVSKTGLLGDFITRVTFAVFRAIDPFSNDFFMIPETATTLEVPNADDIGSVYFGSTEDLDVAVGVNDRLLLAMFSETTPGYTATSTISGTLSGSLLIV